MSEETHDIVAAVWKELYDRYKELRDVGERIASVPRVAVVGQPDSGPEQLCRGLFGGPRGQTDHVDASGRTWRVVATFQLDDVPGLGVVGADGSEERALAYLREADATLLTLLADRRPTELEQGLYDHLRRLHRVHAAVVQAPLGESFTPRRAPEIADAAWAAWTLELRRVFANSDLACFHVRYLASDDLVTLAQHLHEKLDGELKLAFIGLLRHEASRDKLVTSMIHGLSRTAALLGLNPLPFSDMIAITPVQILLVCRVAAAYGHKVTPKWAKEFILATGMVGAAGLGFRAVFREIVRRLAEPAAAMRMFVGCGVAYSGTLTMGHAARLYFISNGRLTPRQAGRRAADRLRRPTELPPLMSTPENDEAR